MGKTPHFQCRGSQVPSLDGELRSHGLCSTAKQMCIYIYLKTSELKNISELKNVSNLHEKNFFLFYYHRNSIYGNTLFIFKSIYNLYIIKQAHLKCLSFDKCIHLYKYHHKQDIHFHHPQIHLNFKLS